MLHETSFQIINMYSIGVKTGIQSYCDTSYSRGGVNQMWIQHSWTNSFNLSFSLEWGIVVYRVEKSNVLMLLQEERDLACMYSNISLERSYPDPLFSRSVI
jgi:hypothetical protein